jgi:probable F420-dependent oxidoreductase
MATQRPFRFGIVTSQVRSADEWVAKARRIESLGYSTMLLPDTAGPTLSPIPALAVAAAATRTLRVGPYVLANDFRNPVLLARESATLDLLSNGRFELGLGAGRPHADEDYGKLGIQFDSGGVRVDRLTEALGIVKGLLAGERVTTAGRHYAVTDAEIFPRPVQQPRPPILVAASGRRLLALAAREADIVAVAGRPDESEPAIKEKIDWVREAAGDRFDQIELNVNLMAVGREAHPQALRFLGVDADQLMRSGSPFVLMGTVDRMCDDLLARRERLGVSYVLVGEFFMEALAPVVERLAGR